MNEKVNLGEDSHSVFGNRGTALMIHARADDLKTDPAGNAWDRIAPRCDHEIGGKASFSALSC